MSKTPGRKFAEGVALDIVKQDRQLISSRAIGMIAAEFDAATAECDCPTTPASAALAEAAVKFSQSGGYDADIDAFNAAVAAYLAAQEPTP